MNERPKGGGQKGKEPRRGGELRLGRAEVRRSAGAEKAGAENAGAVPTVPERMHVLVEVENPGDQPLHVFSGYRTYDYDAATGVLSVTLTGHPEPRPGIQIISHHPRAPVGVVVAANGSTTLDVPVPAVVRRRVAGEGLGMSFVEEPIERIDRVELHVQYANEPIELPAGESPEQHRERFRAQGRVLNASISLTPRKEH
jgi:hypothetical protein